MLFKSSVDDNLEYLFSYLDQKIGFKAFKDIVLLGNSSHVVPKPIFLGQLER